MDVSPLVIVFGAAAAMFAILLAIRTRERRTHGRSLTRVGHATEIGMAGMLSVNLAGMLGLAWLIAHILVHDGVMLVEIGLCAVLIAVLAVTTGGALALGRRGRSRPAAALLAAAALPSIAAYGLLVYLDSHPIDMR